MLHLEGFPALDASLDILQVLPFLIKLLLLVQESIKFPWRSQRDHVEWWLSFRSLLCWNVVVRDLARHAIWDFYEAVLLN